MRFANLRRNIMAVALLATAGMPLPASATDTVKLAAITRTVFYVPLWVAMHRGFLTDEGLDVQVTFSTMPVGPTRCCVAATCIL